MNRKDFIVGIVVASIALAGRPVSADFTNIIDFTSLSNPYWSAGDSSVYGKMVVNGTDFSYVHDISYLGDFPGDVVTSATLALTFRDDEADGGTRNNEITKVGVWSGSDWFWSNLGNVESGDYTGPDIDVGWLNDDGRLSVTIAVTNNSGDVYLKTSMLSGMAAVPVPAGIVLSVLGFAVAGWKLRRFI